MKLQNFGLKSHVIKGCLGMAGGVLLVFGCASRRTESPPAAPAAAPIARSSEYDSRYRYPLVSPGTQFAELPPAVQRTIRAETGSSQIFDIQKGTNSEGGMVYRVIFENEAVLPPLYVAPNGSLLHPDLSLSKVAPQEVVTTKTSGPSELVTVQDLPTQVIKAIQGQAPDAEISTITKETRGGQVVYVVTFKHRMHAPLQLGPDGTILRDSGQ
ncbi:MAG TPA: hypothetical protein VL361_20070 [Candidatus Limnocylindrales bacterium]|nr:hypothetical protein [Candidatus Limnocylindrales bacterium]